MAGSRYDGPWDLYEALELVRMLIDPLQKAGFAVGLTGSVLTKGRSEHDLDIIIYPLQSTNETNFEKARDVLRTADFKPFLAASSVKAVWRKKGSLDEKHVEIWNFNKRRVDIFFLK